MKRCFRVCALTCRALPICSLPVALALAGCSTAPPVVTRPVPVEVPGPVVVQPVPTELLQPHPISVGPLAECPMVASARRAEIVKCNADKAAIGQLGRNNSEHGSEDR